MKVLKAFIRAGKMYKPGDVIEGLDDATKKHYLAHGMIAQDLQKPAEIKPAVPEEIKGKKHVAGKSR